MRDAELEQPFLDKQEDTEDWTEMKRGPRRDLVYHGDVRRLLEIRDELIELQKELSEFDENEKLKEDPFPDDQ